MVDKIPPGRLAELRDLVENGREARFYWWHEWRSETRPAVLAFDRYECQLCKARGRYSRAEIVHHVKHLRERPDLALSLYDPETGERQLVSVCKACHEREHPEGLRAAEAAPSAPVTPERWD